MEGDEKDKKAENILEVVVAENSYKQGMKTEIQFQEE